MRAFIIFFGVVVIGCGKNSTHDPGQDVKKAMETRAFEVYQGEPVYMEFKDFFKAFQEAVKTRDRKKLLVLMVDKFKDEYAFPEKEILPREIAVEKISLTLLECLVHFGSLNVFFTNGVGAAFCTPSETKKCEKYGLSFFRIDDLSKDSFYTIPKGWRFTDVYKGD